MVNLFLLINICLNGQNYDRAIKERTIDSICTVKAVIYVEQLLGKNYADKNLTYYSTYSHSDRVVLFQVKNSFCQNRILPVVFNSSLIDSHYTVVDKKTIHNCQKTLKECTLWLDTAEVMKIARKAIDFKSYRYEIQFVFHGNQKTNPTWNVDLTHYRKNGYSKGETISIDALTGKYEISYWYAEP